MEGLEDPRPAPPLCPSAGRHGLQKLHPQTRRLSGRQRHVEALPGPRPQAGRLPPEQRAAGGGQRAPGLLTHGRPAGPGLGDSAPPGSRLDTGQPGEERAAGSACSFPRVVSAAPLSGRPGPERPCPPGGCGLPGPLRACPRRRQCSPYLGSSPGQGTAPLSNAGIKKERKKRWAPGLCLTPILLHRIADIGCHTCDPVVWFLLSPKLGSQPSCWERWAVEGCSLCAGTFWTVTHLGRWETAELSERLQPGAVGCGAGVLGSLTQRGLFPASLPPSTCLGTSPACPQCRADPCGAGPAPPRSLHTSDQDATAACPRPGCESPGRPPPGSGPEALGGL